MSRLISINFKNCKNIDWIYANKVLFKIQNRIVSQIEKKKYRNARNLQRLLLKSLSSKLIASQKIFEIENSQNQNYNLYKINVRKTFPKILNLNNYIQLDKNIVLQGNQIYFYFLQLLWLFALMPLHETISDSNCYNFRLYRDHVDILKSIVLNLENSKFKWVFIIKPSGFYNKKNKQWLIKNLLIEKKFLLDFLSKKQLAKNFLKQYTYNQDLTETTKISLNKIVKNYTLQGYDSFQSQLEKRIALSKTDPHKLKNEIIIYYNNLLFIPTTTPTQTILTYKLIFKFFKDRGLSIKKNRVWTINLNNGFSFLGWFLRKSKSHIIVTINNQNVRAHKLEIKRFLKSARFFSIDKTINLLNKKIYNWQIYYSYASNLNKTWAEMNYYLFWRIWKWCKKKHKNKGSKWVYKKYWSKKGKKEWVFHFNNQYLQSYNYKTQKIYHLSGSINMCKIKNLKKVQEIVFKKYKPI